MVTCGDDSSEWIPWNVPDEMWGPITKERLQVKNVATVIWLDIWHRTHLATPRCQWETIEQGKYIPAGFTWNLLELQPVVGEPWSFFDSMVSWYDNKVEKWMMNRV
jgi:hypothetical protein